MAVTFWGPDPASSPDTPGDHRFLFCVETGGLLYALVQPAVPAQPWPGPVWWIRAASAAGDLPYGTYVASNDPARIVTAMYGAPDPGVDALTVSLERDGVTVMTARAIRREAYNGDGTFAIWIADPHASAPEPAAPVLTVLDGGVLVVDDERAFRPLVGVETRDALYVLIEGPTARDERLHRLLRATAPSGDLPVVLLAGGQRKRSPLLVYGMFPPPGPDVATLDLTVEFDGDPVMRAGLIRRP